MGRYYTAGISVLFRNRHILYSGAGGISEENEDHGRRLGGMGINIADAYLSHYLGDGYEWWPNFYEFHKLACDELDAFDYEEFKKNGFEVKCLGDYPLELMTKPDDIQD